MISRCPSCGSQVKEDECRCGSCGWDFDKKKCVPLTDKQQPPSSPAPRALPPPPAEGFSLPLARNLNESAPKPTGAPPQVKPTPAASESVPPKEEAAFTLPVARGPMSPIIPPKPSEPVAKKPEPEPEPETKAEPENKKKPQKQEPPPRSKPEPLPEREPVSQPQPEPEPAPALALPSQPDDMGLPSERESLPISDEPREREPAPKASRTPPPPATGAAASRRGSPVYIAAVAGAAIGTVSVLAVYLLLRPETPAVQYSASGASPFAQRTPPAEAVAPQEPVSLPARPVAPLPPPPPPPTPTQPVAATPPAQNNISRPAAVFAAPRVTLATPLVPKVEKTEAPKAPPKKVASRPAWVFEGVIFDLLTARGVFAAKLSFIDQDGNVVGTTSTGGGGSYKISVPAGGPKGYSLRISHPDYTERYIDEGDATSSLREATPEERKILMQAAARNLPWIGMAKNSVRRDLGLVPKTTEEP